MDKSFSPPKLPLGVERVLDYLIEAGHLAYVVGGAPRDWLLQRQVNDYDVATSAKPDEVAQVFRRVIPVGLQHGTVTVVLDGTAVEVTTFRRGGCAISPAGRTEDGYSKTIEDDLAARDFTVNALAWTKGPTGGYLVDPFGGVDDIKKRLLRAVGKGEDRFREDPLRVLRGCRMAATLEFSVAPKTKVAMEEYAQQCSLCAVERITAELTKLLAARKPSRGLRLLADLGLAPLIVPEASSFELCDETSKDLPTRLAALFFTAGPKKTQKRLKALKFSKNVALLAQRLVSHAEIRPEELIKGADVRHFVSHVGEDIVEQVLDLMKARNLNKSHELALAVAKERESGCAFTIGDLAINGADVMKALGDGGGPKVGAVLSQILKRVLDNPSWNKRDKLLELLSTMTAKE